MNEPKQVIVVRKDLNMRKGKLVAQGSHASLGAILKLGSFSGPLSDGTFTIRFEPKKYHSHKAAIEWINGPFKKICVYVNSEYELLELYEKSKELDLISVLITDAGRTEFHGVPTNTCMSVLGYSVEVDKLTGNLPLF